MKRVTTTRTTADVVSTQSLLHQLQKANRVITRLYDRALRAEGVTAGQVIILVVIARLDLARPVEICNRLKMDHSTVSRNVERMQARGWIEVVDDKEDARAHQLRLSAEGRRLLESVQPIWGKVQQTVKDRLGRDGVAALVKAAEKGGDSSLPKKGL